VAGVLLIGAALAVSLLTAASVRSPSLVTTLLAAYLAFVADLGLVTWALSPFHGVTRIGLAAVEALLLAAALAVWWRRGRPGLPLAVAVPSARRVVSDPVSGLCLAAVAVLLAYELVVALTAPANNWDSLTYHLSRAAGWMQHGGVYRIPNAPTPRMNEYQPLAEQQILYLFVAVGSGALLALPQYLAELAILVAVYGTARRLGFDVRAAACSALLFATFSLVALESTTAQNDLIAASFPVAAACLLLGDGRLEPALAGIAVGLGIGAKLTTALVLPVLLALALLRGRRATLQGIGGAVASFAAIGVCGYALNLANTGHLLGYLGTHIDTPVYEQPAHPSKLANGVDVLYETLDLSVLSDHAIELLWIAGVLAAVACVLWRRRLDSTALLVAAPFVSPIVVLHAGDVVASLARSGGFPVRGGLGNIGDLNRTVSGSAFGPVGAVVFLGVPLVTLVAFLRHRAALRELVLAAAVPLFYVLLAQETFNYFMTRFLIVPAALTAPLAARLLGTPAARAAFLAVGVLVAGQVVTEDPSHPLRGSYGRPWQLTQVDAAYLTDERGVGDAVAALGREVPAHACVGAVLGSNEPAFFLSGPRLARRVVYLPVADALDQAYRRSLSYVVVSTGQNRWAAGTFRRRGWQIRPLGGYWLLAVAPNAGDGDCRA
jgi:4-amino-4-deoxy-L-arabinose transferase-like glycosyltransferase